VSWYLDLSMIESYWAENQRTYHHTAPISMTYALHEALGVVLEEGLAERFERHRLHSTALLAGLRELGCPPSAQEGHRLPMLNAVHVPAGIEEATIRRRLLVEHNIEIGGGLGELAGIVWRIGLMGESARKESVLRLLAALEALLPDNGRTAREVAREAAAAVYES
jgi:alanine-glyoxylate transaminase/serine-glyoxylate transaminase/serine-pyruvate transaminase